MCLYFEWYFARWLILQFVLDFDLILFRHCDNFSMYVCHESVLCIHATYSCAHVLLLAYIARSHTYTLLRYVLFVYFSRLNDFIIMKLSSLVSSSFYLRRIRFICTITTILKHMYTYDQNQWHPNIEIHYLLNFRKMSSIFFPSQNLNNLTNAQEHSYWRWWYGDMKIPLFRL